MNAMRTHAAFKVLSHSALDGFRVDHFLTERDAREFAALASAAGFHCVVCQVLGVAEGAA